MLAKLIRNMVCFPAIVLSFKIKAMQPEIGRQVTIALYVVAMAAVIVGVDFAFFRNRFRERLTVNIGIVLVFAAFYLRFTQALMKKARHASFLLGRCRRNSHSLRHQPAQ